MNGKEWFIVGAFVGLLTGVITGLASCAPDAPSFKVSEQYVVELAG